MLTYTYVCMDLEAGGGSVTVRCLLQDVAVPTGGYVGVQEFCAQTLQRDVFRR